MLTASCITQLHLTPTPRVYILQCWSPSYKLIPFTHPQTLQIVSGHWGLHVKICFTTFAFWFRAYTALTIKRSCQGWSLQTSCPRSLNPGHFLGSQTSSAMWIKMRGLDWLQNLSHDGVVEGRAVWGQRIWMNHSLSRKGQRVAGGSSASLCSLAAQPMPHFTSIWSPKNSSRAHICLHKAFLEVHLEFLWSKVINTLSHSLSSKFLEGGVHEAPAILPSSWTHKWPPCATKTKTNMHRGRDGHCLINAAGDLLNLPSCYFLSCVSFLPPTSKEMGLIPWNKRLWEKKVGKERHKGHR